MKGIYRSTYSFRAIVNTARGRKEKRFPLDTPPAEMKRWREETIGRFAALRRAQTPRPDAIRGSFAADVTRYLAALTIASTKARASDLNAWVVRFGHKPRARITRADVEAALVAWQQPRKNGKPYAPWTLTHRLNALRSFYRWADGPDASTPLEGVTLARPTAGSPVFVSPRTIEAVAKAITDPKTRARFLVLATHGVRPSELQRAQPGDVDLRHKVWSVRTAKGGIARVLRLNAPEMRAAWRAYAAADAWGAYDTTQHARRLRKAGWPAGVRPYALRGTWGMELSRRGVDLADIQQLMGHRDQDTTRLYYVPPEDSRLSQATARMAGRLSIPRAKR